MKKNNRVFSTSNLPKRIPLFPAITTGLLLDRCDAPGWLWGSLALFFALCIIGAIAENMNSTKVDYFNNDF